MARRHKWSRVFKVTSFQVAAPDWMRYRSCEPAPQSASSCLLIPSENEMGARRRLSLCSIQTTGRTIPNELLLLFACQQQRRSLGDSPLLSSQVE